MSQIGVEETYRPLIRVNPIQPRNFLIDPNAASVDEALGVAIDEYVSQHTVEMLQEQGVYRDVYVASAAPDTDLEPDQDLTVYNDDKVRLTKYYGLVPRELLNAAVSEDDEETVPEFFDV